MLMKQDTWTLQRKFFNWQILSYLPLAAQKFTLLTSFSEYQANIFGKFLKRKVSNQTNKFSFDIVRNIENLPARKNTGSITISISSATRRQQNEVNAVS